MRKLIAGCFIIAALVFLKNTAVAAPVISCDTITNLTSRDTLTFYYADPDVGGYLSGNNGYGDLEKAEELSGPVGSQLTGAFIGFGYAHVLSADSSTTVTINAYAATGAGGSPGATPLATATVTLRQIANSIGTEGLYIPFGTPPTLTANKFFISVVLPTTGDTIVVLTNTMTSLDGDGWEKWSSGAWHAYNKTYYTFPYFFGNDISAVTCGGEVLAAFQSSQRDTCASSLTVQFYNTSSNGVAGLVWYFPGGTPDSSIVADPVVTYSASGTYHVELIAIGLSGNDTTTANVVVSPAVTGTTSTTPASSATDTNGTATVVGTGGTPPLTFSWSDANYDTSETIINQQAGTYYVTITDAVGCGVVESAVIGYTNGIIALGDNKQVKFYPNPASDILNLEWSTATTAEIRISDMNGRVVARFNTENRTTNTLSIHDLATGSYILTITDRSTNQEQSVKFLKL